ncbi:putative transcription factor/ chromatin remodeling BED-type(Zn) family [Rosa chinensis]|uniref:Putative transcription factor/ chromatin remodeling BED-type(Zn) family n=1 Tax=Rosa chinensis TaxID=74649 RepID=A0A2P6RZE9_ROSCH|nr:uncharacterized protein LOC112190502 [Rosa chinensis]XP_040371063.1 uncharacterized protein LOC112190502 [Rosa chinensis]PRQ51797.1 putative transcription factor/ chromatin remodeling BED-type(Zn) family [Rosa chinensis]
MNTLGIFTNISRITNIHDHGRVVDSKKGRFQCNYCDKEVSGITRLKCHLGGIGPEVKPCLEVPAEVKELWRNKLLESRGKKVNHSSSSNGVKRKKHETSQTSSYQDGSEEDTDSMSEENATDYVNSPNGNIGLQRGESNDMRNVSISMNPQKCIGRFFYETGLEFTAANSPSFKRMINSVAGPGVNYKIPSCEELKGCIFQDEVKEMQEYVRKIKESWATTGCSILLDSWIDEKGRNLVNFLVNCPQGPVYLCTHDVSSSIGNVDAIRALLEGIIKDVGADNVVQIVADSTTGWVGALGKEFSKHKGVFWAVSGSHCIELMLEKIGMSTSTKGILDKAKTITKFIHGHEEVLKILKKHTCGRDLIKPSKIRGAMPFMTLDSIVYEKQELKDMFASSEWNMSIWGSRVESKMVADIVEDQSFWIRAEMVSKATMPLVRAIELIFEADKPLVGHIYETMDQVKERIKEELINKKSHYRPFWEVIDDIWDNILHIPLHGAGYYLNPSLKYSNDFYCDDEVYLGLMCCIAQMVRDPSIQDVIHNQLKEYIRAEGSFKEGSSSSRRITHPAMWWSSYGKQCPELQRFAIRVLSQNCDGATRYGLRRTLAEKLVTNGRNPIEQQRLSDLTFLHYNLQLQKFCSGVKSGIEAEDIHPMDDWIIDEAQDIVSQNGDVKVEPANGATSEGCSRLQLKIESM